MFYFFGKGKCTEVFSSNKGYHARGLLPDRKTFVFQCWYEDAVYRSFASMHTFKPIFNPYIYILPYI